MLPPLILAGHAARLDVDLTRRAYLGAVAFRPDGKMVSARNGSAIHVSPSCHAEARVLRKCGAGSRVYVARVLRDGTFANAMPCGRCRAAMRAKGITVVTYTVGPCEWRSEQLSG